jgi:hypothetical protein
LSQIAGNLCSRCWQIAATIAAAMEKSGIGVQQILPRLGADWQGKHAPPERGNEYGGGNDAPPSEHMPSPPAPGTGLVVDKSV